MVMAVSFTRYGRLYYLDPGAHPEGRRQGARCPPTTAPRWPSACGRRSGSSEDTGGLPGAAPASPADEDLRPRRGATGSRKAEARGGAKRLIREHELPMKVVAVDHARPTRRTSVHDLLHRPAPGRLPRPRPRPGPHPALPGRAAPARRPRRGPRAGRHRLVRPRPVLRDVPQRLRAGHHPDGQGPGPAAQPAADLRRLRPADVLPEVRAPAVLNAQGRTPRRRLARSTPPRARAGRRPQRPLATPSSSGWTTDGRRCACPSASVCSPRKQHDAMYNPGD